MMLTAIFRRFAANRTAILGKDAQSGKIFCYVDAENADVSTAQNVRIAPEEVRIKFTHDGDGKAYLQSIQTRWNYYHLNNSGKVIPSYTATQTMQSNNKDINSFFAMFGMPILMFMLNGLIRAISWLGSNNYQPLFNGAGQVIPDSNYNTEIEGDGTYNTHAVDGTAISGVVEENIDVTPWRS